MRYRPSTEEANILRSQALPDSHQDLDDDDLHRSASKWTEKHLQALRVVHLDNLPLERFFSDRFIPKKDNQVYRELCDRIQDATEDDIRRWKPRDWKGHPFKTLFSRLAQGVTTGVPKAPKSANQAPTYDDTSSSDSAASTSDKEDKPEHTARSCIQALVEDILVEAEEVSVINDKWEFAVNGTDIRTKVLLGKGNWPITAINDGGIALLRQSATTGNNRWGAKGIVGFEAKRRHAGGRLHAAGQQEPPNDKLLAQEFANLLGRAMAASQRASTDWTDQEAWQLTMHGTEMRIMTAYFLHDYLAAVNSSHVPLHQRITVFRSRPINLKRVAERPQAVKVIMALTAYMKSGEARDDFLDPILKP